MDASRSSCWFPTQTLMLLLTITLPGSQTAKDPSSPCILERAVGESVQLPPNCSSCPDTREIEWNWSGKGDRRLLVCWKPNTSVPEWYKIEEKYKSRLSLTEMGFLTITNLTMEMSGVYTADTKFHSGASQKKAFRLYVYEPVPHPQILIHSSSHTSSWCNVSLECGAPGATENLTVAWESQDLPRELEQSGALGLAPNPWNLSLTLPLNQTNTSLTCVVSNPVDRKNVTLRLDSICLPGGSVQRKWIWSSILPMVLMVMLVLGAGVWVWVKRKKKTGKGASWAAAPQAFPTGETAELQEYDVYSNTEAEYPKVSPLRQPQPAGPNPLPTCDPTIYATCVGEGFVAPLKDTPSPPRPEHLIGPLLEIGTVIPDGKIHQDLGGGDLEAGPVGGGENTGGSPEAMILS